MFGSVKAKGKDPAPGLSPNVNRGSTAITTQSIRTPEVWCPCDTGGFPDCLLGYDSILRHNTFLLCMLTYFPQAILSVFVGPWFHQIPIKWLTLGVSVCLSSSYKHKPYQALFGLVLAVSRKVWALVAIFRARKWTSSVRWMTGYPMAYQSWGDETSLDERLSLFWLWE